MASRAHPVGPVSVVVLAAVAAACGAPADEAPAVSDAAQLAVPRTADPAARGLSESDFPRVQEIARDVYTYEQLRTAGDERFTTVSLFVVTPAGVLVADGQGSVAETERLVRAVAEVTDQPVTHVVIGSDHGDHTAGNAAFPSQAVFFAHPASAENLRASASARLPDALVEDHYVLTLGGTDIEMLFLGRAHTGGDLVVHLPRQKVLFMSEAYLNRVFPAMRSAYPSEWVEMIRRAQAMDVDVYVPGHGFVESPGILKEELETFRQAVERVIAEATRLHQAGLTVDEAAAEADFGELETWSLSGSQRSRALQQVYAELNGELPRG